MIQNVALVLIILGYVAAFRVLRRKSPKPITRAELERRRRP